MARTTGSAAAPRWELSDEDFDAYSDARARATTMSSRRAAVKRRLVAWMQGVAQKLAESGIDLELAATDEHPSARNAHRVDAQTVSLFQADTPSRAAREPNDSRRPAIGGSGDEPQPESGHGRVELRIDASGASFALRLGGDARRDLEHAAAMLSLQPEEVVTVWEAMPEEIAIEARPSLSSRARPLGGLSPRGAAQLAKEALESDVPLIMGVRASRKEVADGAAENWFEIALALGRLLHTLAWSAEGEAWIAARTAERRSPSSRGRLPKRGTARAAVREAPEAPSKTLITIERGAHVRALSGPFAGQSGVVQELDGKGGARVLFGLLAARVELRDLAVKGKERGRPVLSSSHRKLGSHRKPPT